MTVKFERQHFNALAKLFADYAPEFEDNTSDLGYVAWRDLIDGFCDYFEKGNERFDRTLFQYAIQRHLLGE